MSVTPNTPTREKIDQATFDKFLEQGLKLAQIGAVEVTKPLAAQLTQALQSDIAALLPESTQRATDAAAKASAAADQRKLEINHRLWQAIHTRPRSDLWTPGKDDLPFLQDIVSKVPGCQRCRTNATAYFKSSPPDFTTRESYFAWTVGLHNSASADAGKPALSLAEALVAWPS